MGRLFIPYYPIKIMATDLSFRLDTQIKELRLRGVVDHWKMVEMLRAARRGEIWKQIGYDTWASYLAQPEISLKQSTVDNYITVFNRFEEVNSPIGELAYSRARLIAPHITEANVEEMTEKAESLSWSDLRVEIKIMNGGKEPEETGRPAKPLFVWCAEHQKWSLTKLQLKSICIH